MVENQDRWLEDPQEVLKELLINVRELGEPMAIEIADGLTALAQLVAI